MKWLRGTDSGQSRRFDAVIVDLPDPDIPALGGCIPPSSMRLPPTPWPPMA
ncbi:spermidine synthase domain protein [Mycobacterium ulcerans str. Harvey]|uniref:Spermidine synthase domain protein n=1 Tax=Mycobacterium ulcerans str. Harvey TaxID=1299332 RepID=A0ABN0R8Z3_MYCUL|nr:spermidine synthase domain protein [Mycobacterium ulcerans str. Harvey]